MTRRTHAKFLAGIVAVLAVLAGGTADSMTPSATVTTAIIGWEHWLDLQWAARPLASGQEIDGYVYNRYGGPIYRVQILAQGLDATGNLVQQRLAWVPGTVPGFQRVYFRIPPLAPAQTYRVTVWAFDLVQSKSMP